MSVGALALAVHVVGTSFMCGLNWLVQTVHYPLFPFAEGPQWTEFHAEHSRRITWVVGVPWAMQGLGALGVVAERPGELGAPLAFSALVLAGITVMATVVFALPAHATLANGFDGHAHRRLVATNWIRTVAWTAGVAVSIAMVVQSLST